MLSERQRRRHYGSRERLLTTGGINEYRVDPSELKLLVKLLTGATKKGNLHGLLTALLTNRELADLTRRVVIARALMNGKTYDEINQNMKTGKATIAAVKQSLELNGGVIRLAFATMEGIHEMSVDHYWVNRIKKGK